MAKGKYRTHAEATRAREGAMREVGELQRKLDAALHDTERNAQAAQHRIDGLTAQITALRQQVANGTSQALSTANQQILALRRECDELEARDAKRSRQYERSLDRLVTYFCEHHHLTRQEGLEAAFYLLNGSQAVIVTETQEEGRKDLHVRALMDQAAGKRRGQNSASARIFGADVRGKAITDLHRMHEERISGWSSAGQTKSRRLFWAALVALDVREDELSYADDLAEYLETGVSS